MAELGRMIICGREDRESMSDVDRGMISAMPIRLAAAFSRSMQSLVVG